MRPRFNNQSQFRFQARATLKITESYYGRYDRIDAILAEHPELVELIHGDIAEPLDCEMAADATGADCYKCASETVLRMVICQTVEGCSLREIVVRIDDSEFLRRFVRVYNDPMIDYSTFCRLRNRIEPETWKHINQTLARTAVDQGDISGERIRLDTTAVETNIHWPTDSSLLGDCYRTLARLVDRGHPHPERRPYKSLIVAWQHRKRFRYALIHPKVPIPSAQAYEIRTNESKNTADGSGKGTEPLESTRSIRYNIVIPRPFGQGPSGKCQL